MDNEEIKETKKRRKLRWKWIAIVAAILIVTNFAAFFVGTKAAMAIPGMGVSNKDIKSKEKHLENKLEYIKKGNSKNFKKKGS